MGVTPRLITGRDVIFHGTPMQLQRISRLKITNAMKWSRAVRVWSDVLNLFPAVNVSNMTSSRQGSLKVETEARSNIEGDVPTRRAGQ